MQNHKVLPIDTSAKKFLANRTKDNFMDLMESFAFCYYNDRVVRVPVEVDENGNDIGFYSLALDETQKDVYFPVVTQYGTDHHDVQSLIKLKNMVDQAMKEPEIRGICINPWDNRGVLLAKSIISAILELYAGMKFFYSEITSRSFFYVIKFAEQEKMCTNSKASNEDLLPFRYLTLVWIGQDDLKKMVEAVTDDEIDKEDHNWLDPFEYVMQALDKINPDCPLYRRFKEYRPSDILN